MSRRGLYILHPCSACLYLISAPWHFIVPACKYWNLHPIVSGYYAYLKITARAWRRESLHERTRKHIEEHHGFRTGAKQLFPIVKVSVISSKGAFDIKELQVFQADSQVNRMSEYFDLAAAGLSSGSSGSPSSPNRKQLLSGTTPSQSEAASVLLTARLIVCVHARVCVRVQRDSCMVFFSPYAAPPLCRKQENNRKPEFLPRWDEHSRYKCEITSPNPGCQEDKRCVAAQVRSARRDLWIYSRRCLSPALLKAADSRRLCGGVDRCITGCKERKQRFAILQVSPPPTVKVSPQITCNNGGCVCFAGVEEECEMAAGE